ncbi:MAG: hypothetical protein HUJ98_14815, partial [Bacteroidaceae bacterium]|nr:hypothetical protein [Bacteroidaceae bacterium]
MNCRKHIISLLLMAISISSAYAQTGISSPVSRYGFGELSDMTLGKTVAMGGASIGLRSGQEINIANPASYSAVDSLTFLLDAGVTLQNTNYSNGVTRLNNKNAHFDHVVMQFRAFRKVGVALGFAPYSRVGYSFDQLQEPISDIYDDVTPAFAYKGEGGISKAFLGIGWNPIAGLSIGANGEYLFGDITHTITNAYSNTNVLTNARSYTANISTFNVNLGIQYELPISKLDRITIGATFTPGHDINKMAYRQDYLLNLSTNL